MLKTANHQRNAYKTTVRYHLTLSEWLSSKRPQITSAGKDVEKREPLYAALRMSTGTATGCQQNYHMIQHAYSWVYL